MALVPVILSALLVSAHMLRFLGPLGLVVGIAPLSLLLVHKPWAARVLQVLLVVAGLEWVRSIAQIAADRIAIGDPWHRMAVILGSVALFTMLSALVFQLRSMRERFSMQ